jgi:hypothetical protein
MHFQINKFLTVALLAGVSLAGCKKEAGTKAPLLENQNDAYVRVVHASPSFRTVFSNRDTFNVYAGATRINSPFLTYSSFFPGATVNNYVALPAGNQLFRLSVPGVLNADSVNLYSFTKTLQGAQRYSLIITDSIKSNNDRVQMWLKDNFTTPVPGQFGIRFIHAVLNDTAAGKTVDVYSTKLKANMFTNVPVGTATGFQYFNTPTTGDTIIIRRNNTLYEITRLNNMSQSSGRVYSLLYRGSALTTGTKGRLLTSYLNL